MKTETLFPTLYGRDLVAEESEGFPSSYAVVTTRSPWRIVEPLLHHPPERAVLVSDLDLGTLDAALAEVGPVEAFVGVGAGMAVDAAKYMAWQRGVKLFQIPTATSSNAPFFPGAAVRNAPTRPLGHIYPEAILVDFDVIREAPRALNVAGAGDVLAVHTGLADWELASTRGVGPEWDSEMAEQLRTWVGQLEAAADDVAALTDAGIRLLMEKHEEMGLMAAQPDPCPLSGSEHWWVQNLERLTGRHFLHGEVVCLGIVIASWIQLSEPQRMRDLIGRLGIRYKPADLGLEKEVIKESLETLPGFMQERHPQRYSWINEFRLSPEAWRGLCQWLGLE